MTPQSTPTTSPEQIAQDLRAVVNDADAMLKKVDRSGGDAQLDALRERLASQLHRARQQFDEFQDTATYRAREAARKADLAVQTHPYTAVGVAAALGALAGLLMARRR